MVDFTLKVGDTSPALGLQFTDENDDPVDIRGFNEVSFYLKDFETGDQLLSETESNGDVKVTDAENGKVKYEWSNEDTNEKGIFEGEFEVEYSDGTKESFPNRRSLVVKINPNNEV